MPEPFVVDGVWIPKAIVGIRSRYAVPLYLELRRHCYEAPECFPSVRRLARLVGCAIGTVSALTDQFHALGIVTKLHDERHCVYRFAQSCWRRRKSRKFAYRSVGRTEDKNNYVVPVDRAQEPKKPDISQRSALACRAQQRTERRNKRINLIKTARRWVEASPDLAEDERPYRLLLLDRCEAQVDDWWGRSKEDQRAFDLLIARARAAPLAGAVVDSLRQAPLGMRAIGMVLPVLGGKPGPSGPKGYQGALAAYFR
jgi:hypothetical protein